MRPLERGAWHVNAQPLRRSPASKTKHEAENQENDENTETKGKKKTADTNLGHSGALLEVGVEVAVAVLPMVSFAGGRLTRIRGEKEGGPPLSKLPVWPGLGHNDDQEKPQSGYGNGYWYGGGGGACTHLRRVELIFAHDLDGDLFAGQLVDSLVHVGERAIAHLLDELVTLEALFVSFMGVGHSDS